MTEILKNNKNKGNHVVFGVNGRYDCGYVKTKFISRNPLKEFWQKMLLNNKIMWEYILNKIPPNIIMTFILKNKKINVFVELRMFFIKRKDRASCSVLWRESID